MQLCCAVLLGVGAGAGGGTLGGSGGYQVVKRIIVSYIYGYCLDTVGTIFKHIVWNSAACLCTLEQQQQQ